jgi:hypothetical protein
MNDLLSIRVDVEYAIRQLREHADVERALDALARVLEACDNPSNEEE